MVLPTDVVTEAERGNLDFVRTWLNNQPDGGRECIDDHDEYGMTLLLASCSPTPRSSVQCVALARLLLSLGADVNICAADVFNDHLGQTSPLHEAAHWALINPEMLHLILEAGGNVKASTSSGLGYIETPLASLLRNQRNMPYLVAFRHLPGVVAALLRVGAELDDISVRCQVCEQYQSVEALLQRVEHVFPSVGSNEDFIKVKAYVHGVRSAGSWKSYARRAHKDVCAVRGLVTRGFLAPPSGGSEYDRALAFLVGLGDNGIVWNVLSYWRSNK